MKRKRGKSKRQIRFNRQHPRDDQGRFRPGQKRDKRGRFLPVPGRKRKPVPGRKRKAPPQKPPPKPPIGGFPPVFDLCVAADRQDFYDEILHDYKQQLKTLSPEDVSALRVVVDVIGTPKPRKTKAGKKSRRKTTAFIGERTFANLRRFKRFLLLDTGTKSGVDSNNPFGLDWSKEGMCQFQKSARLVVRKERGKEKVLKRYKLGS